MLRKQSKKLAIMLVLSMIASLFVGVGAASAANGVAVSVSRVYTFEGDAGNQKLGDLQIKEDSDYPNAMATGDSFVITLPSNLKWQTKDGKYVGAVEDDALDIKISGNYTMSVKVLKAKKDAKDTYSIPMYVNFDGVEDGNAYATIDGMDSPVPSGDFAIANVLGGGTTAVCTDTTTLGPDCDGKFTFRLTETSAGTLAGANDTIKLTLPTKISVKDITVNGLAGFSGSMSLKDFIDDNNDHKVKFKLADLKDINLENDTKTRGILEFVVKIEADSDASEGDITLDIEGSDKVDDASIKVGVIAEYGVTLSVDDPTTVLSGRVCQEVGTLVIYENVKDTISGKRSITVTLPDGVKFSKKITTSDVACKKGTGSLIKDTYNKGYEITDADEDSFTLKVDSKGTERLKFEISIKNVNLRADYVGDIVATIDGRAGVEGEVVLGTVVAPIEVKVASVADVKIGYQSQALSDITITETEAGALLEDGEVRVELPAGVEFQDKDVKVEVTNGNLEINGVKVKAATDKDNAYIVFKVKSESSAKQPGTVTISNVMLDVNRTVAEGPIKAAVTGSAVVWSYEGNVNNAPVDKEYDAKDDAWQGGKVDTDYVFDEDEFGRFVIANCVTPGVSDVVGGAEAATSTFVIGSTAASIAGSDVTMPVAPYISNSRTQLPVRYVAYACGVPEANVIWNPDNRTVTLLNNNGTVVQLAIGSTTMLVNGVAVVMDVAPEITGGYTFLPARYVANAFNYDAAWEAATQTVTITPIVK
jgi:sporulation protein YlmC with PRC-barrel domain